MFPVFRPSPPTSRCPISASPRTPESAQSRLRPPSSLRQPDREAVLEFARAAATGLTDTPRWLPSHFLYDARGSALFEEITRQPEYYLTDAETAILGRHADEIARTTGAATLIELGSGYSVKTSHLLEAYARGNGRVIYVPVDVSAAALDIARERIREHHPGVVVDPIQGRYEEAYRLFRRHSPSVVAFLGSTIGNFTHGESLAFWRQVSDAVAEGDHFLLGVDLVKDRAVLEAAYNDRAGVTAAFTKNLFVRMNSELGAGIDVEAVEHVARYNPAWQRIEIFARFTTPQRIHIRPLDVTVWLDAGAMVMTEVSRKFVLADVQGYVRNFGFSVEGVFTDEREWFGVVLLRRYDGRMVRR